MSTINKMFRFLIAAVLVAMIFPLALSAYIDPGTGSYILQVLIAAFVAVSFTTKVFWKRIKKFFSRKKEEKPEPLQESADEK
jgi:dolichol kinase